MHQDLILHPFLDGLHIRNFAEILVKFAKVRHGGPFVVGFLRIVIEDDLAAELMHPDFREEVHGILMLRVFSDVAKNFVLNSLDKSD